MSTYSNLVDPNFSPSWHLDAWLVARAEYYAALSANIDAMSEEDQEAHMVKCDRLLKDLDEKGTVINRLFGSAMVDGVWDNAATNRNMK